MATINGRVKRYDGTAIDYVLIFSWKNGQCIANRIPDTSGNWSFDYEHNAVIGITYVADGCEPISHGPYEIVVNK